MSNISSAFKQDLDQCPVPISQEAAERIRDEYNAARRKHKERRWRDPIVLDQPPTFVPAPKPKCIFICEYCGSMAESIEPCKNCLAPRTREQLEALVMMEY